MGHLGLDQLLQVALGLAFAALCEGLLFVDCAGLLAALRALAQLLGWFLWSEPMGSVLRLDILVVKEHFVFKSFIVCDIDFA